MSAYWYCLATKVVAVAGFAVLVIFDSPFWGLLCFFAMAGIDGEIKP